ncbi:MAG: hypothetical protein DMF54_13070 [Acidobacteria bacterium]|nr:MAG: hypothetical protein DMF54_13070 [Acidobacteriota bacterium]
MAGGGAVRTTAAVGTGIGAPGGVAPTGETAAGGDGTGVVSAGGGGAGAASAEGVGEGVGETSRSWARPVRAESARMRQTVDRDKLRRFIEMSAKYSEM